MNLGMELKAEPIEPFCNNTCGTCMYLVQARNPKHEAIKSGKGKGQTGWWKCSCENATNFGQYRVCQDGAKCKHWDNKYESDKKLEKWIAKCYQML